MVQVGHDDAVVVTVAGEVDIGTVLLLDKEPRLPLHDREWKRPIADG